MTLANDIHNALSAASIVERDTEFPFRHHLGASLLGKGCNRYLWYSFRWAKLPSHSARIQRIFNRGRSEELRIIEALRKTGLTISTTLSELCINLHLPVELNSLDIIANYGLRVYKPQQLTDDSQIKANFPPHLGGSMDGILHVPANYVGTYGYFMPIEVKTHNQKSFNAVIKNGESMRWNSPQHYVQGNAYATQTGCSHFLYVAENKNTDELYLRDEEAQESVTALNVVRAEQIIYKKSQDVVERTSEKWRCNMCDYKDICKNKLYDTVSHNCRTCAYATANDDGSWTCDVYLNHIEKYTEIDRAMSCEHYERIIK